MEERGDDYRKVVLRAIKRDTKKEKWVLTKRTGTE